MYLQYNSSFFFVLVFAFSISFEVTAQKEAEKFTARQAIYLELGGSSGRYAVNYGRIFHQKEKLKLNVSAGFALWHYTSNFSPEKTTWLPVIPIEFTAIWGRSNHHLELGTGIVSYLQTVDRIDLETYEVSEEIVFSAFVPFRVGYRYQKPGGGFFYRVGYTPILNLPVGGRGNWDFEPRFAGISIGKSF